MSQKIDLSGKTVGKWTVIRRVKGGWFCRCACGTERVVSTGTLNTGASKSCGCGAINAVRQKRINEMVGKQFGRLTVEKYSYSKNGEMFWECSCSCGNKHIAGTNNLNRGNVTSCGCYMRENNSNLRSKNEIGNRYGRLLVIDKSDKQNSKREIYWVCECDCGATAVVRGSHLRSGTIISCGCYAKEEAIKRTTTHGLSKTKAYHRAMCRRRERKSKVLDKNWTGVMEHQLRTLFQQCVLCGMTEKEHQEKFGQSLHVDHVHPLKDGSGLYYGNATVLCATCNSKKHAKKLEDLDEWTRNRLLLTADLFKVLFEPKESL